MPIKKSPSKKASRKSHSKESISKKPAMKSKGVLVVGGIIMDMIVRSDYLKVKDGNLTIPFDSKITLHELTEDIGGSAHNAAANLANLGTKTYLFGAIGKEEVGDIAIRNLKEYHVDTSYVKLKSAFTGTSIVFLVNGEKTILTYRGANDFLGEKDLPKNLFDKIDTMVLTSLISDDNIAMMRKALFAARRKNVKIVMNPSMSMVTHRHNELLYAIGMSSIVILNDKEAKLITGKDDIDGAMDELRRYGPEIVIITRDIRGSMVADGNDLYTVPSYKVKVVDTTGGGDSFTAGFIHAKSRGYSTRDAVRFASGVAALNILTPGASTDLPSEKEVLNFMKKAKYNKE
jgi:ribokinase